MKKIAVFGKPGSGKSILCRHLAAATAIPLHSLDAILYNKNGQQLERNSYDKIHAGLIASDRWIIDGFDLMGTFNQRLDAADTLIYIDLPYYVCYYFVTKRLLTGFVVTPAGWPQGSSMIKGSLQSYKVLKHCPKFWNDDLLQTLKNKSTDKSLHIIRSIEDLNSFVDIHISGN